MDLIEVSDINKKAWSNFVYSNSRGTIFQTPEMYEIYRSTKNYEPLFIGLIDSKGNIAGILISVIQQEFSGPLKSLSRRCVTWGGPLINENLDKKEKLEVLNQILSQQNKIAKKKAIYMQFRNLWDTTWMRDIFEKNRYDYEERLDIIIDLTKSEEDLWNDMTKSRRKGINRGKNKGHEFSEYTFNEPFEDFYQTIVETYDNVKIPLADISYFSSASEILRPNNMAKYFCVKNQDELFATRIVLTYKNMIYDWYAGSSEEGKKTHANEYLVWQMLLWGRENGYEVFDFGGAGKPNEEYGPREFKRRFGGNFVQYGRYNNIYKKTTLKIAKMGLKILKR